MGEAFDAIIDALGDRVITNNGTQAEARCPAHEDTNPSLGVGVGEKGDRCVINCRRGCSRHDVLAAIGKTEKHLFDDFYRGSSSLLTVTKPVVAVKTKKAKKVHPSVEKAGEASLWSVRKDHPEAILATTHLYHAADGKPFGAVFRFHYGDSDKQFRQATATPSGGWITTAGKALWPLFNLHQLPAAGIVTIHEGEKAALAAEALGQIATTSHGGAEAPSKTDWSPLAGREVVIFPDNDQPGEEYADEVAGILAGLMPPAVVRIARVPGLQHKGDVADLPIGTDDELVESRAMVAAAVEAASLVQTITAPGSDAEAAETPMVGELVPYNGPIRNAKWGDLDIEMRWTRHDRQSVTILRGEVVIGMAEMKVATLSTREKFVRKVAKMVDEDAGELDRLLVTMAREGCPKPPESRMTISCPDEIEGKPAVLVACSGKSRSIALDRCQILVASEFYQADESLVSVDVCSNRGTMIVRKITVERLAAWLDANVAFYGIDSETDEKVLVACPDWLSRRMFNLQAFAAIRPVNGIATGPFMRPDGSIGGYQSGYDDQTGVVVSTSGEWPTIPDRPTLADAQAAVATLLDAVKTFPFRGDIDRSVWLASVLTTVARRAFLGPAPMFVATAPLMGAGKSLLQQAASWIATGADAPAAKLGNNDVENEKVIGAILAERPTCLVFDNVAGTLGDPTVDRMLTADVITTRQLGQSSMITVKNAFVAFANGNNLTPKGDIGRRILHMRLEPDNDRPHETQHKNDFRETIMARRRELLAATLTILRYGMTLETPPPIRRLGSFGRWGAVVQTALVAVGQPDPAESQGEMLSDAQDIVGELVAAIADAIPDFRDTAARLVERAFERNTFGGGGFIDDTAAGSRLRDAIDAVVEQHRGGRSGRLEDMRATIMLRVVEAIRDRWFADYRLVRDTKSKHGRRWRVERRGDAWEPSAD